MTRVKIPGTVEIMDKSEIIYIIRPFMCAVLTLQRAVASNWLYKGS